MTTVPSQLQDFLEATEERRVPKKGSVWNYRDQGLVRVIQVYVQWEYVDGDSEGRRHEAALSSFGRSHNMPLVGFTPAEHNFEEGHIYEFHTARTFRVYEVDDTFAHGVVEQANGLKGAATIRHDAYSTLVKNHLGTKEELDF